MPDDSPVRCHTVPLRSVLQAAVEIDQLRVRGCACVANFYFSCLSISPSKSIASIALGDDSPRDSTLQISDTFGSPLPKKRIRRVALLRYPVALRRDEKNNAARL